MAPVKVPLPGPSCLAEVSLGDTNIAQKWAGGLVRLPLTSQEALGLRVPKIHKIRG